VEYTESLASHSTKHAMGNHRVAETKRCRSGCWVPLQQFASQWFQRSTMTSGRPDRFQDPLRNQYMRIWRVSTSFLHAFAEFSRKSNANASRLATVYQSSSLRPLALGICRVATSLQNHSQVPTTTVRRPAGGPAGNVPKSSNHPEASPAATEGQGIDETAARRWTRKSTGAPELG
jgi:hypothetical protein